MNELIESGNAGSRLNVITLLSDKALSMRFGSTPDKKSAIAQLGLPVMVITLTRRLLLFAITVIDEVSHSIQCQNQTYN